MHGAHSPKTSNGPGLNGTTQIKGKKREHSSDSGQLRPEDMLKAEIAKITDKGGLVDFQGVEKVVQLMQPESSDKKVDLASRIMLCNVISVTESSECLGRLVQLRGLLILDEWLQEFHKGKIGDRSPKEGDLSVEEFLFALLRALDKLPVNIHALQTCNVGKSVNHLRSHRNPEITKKARTLVDTWKKSVEAEMNMMERKRVEQMNIIETRSGTRRAGSGSWSNKSMMHDLSPHKQVKTATSQPPVLKVHQGKQSPESSSPTKVPASLPAGTGLSDAPVVTSKEEKSSSSSPCGNNSQSSKGSPVTATPDRTTTDAENISNNQRIIVRLPNMGRSPARTVSGGSVEGGKEGLVGCDEGEAPKGADSAPGGMLKPYEGSYSSINALVESCAKISEVNACGDDVGMNLLASVAAGERSRSDVSSSSCSPENEPPLPENAKDNGSSSQSMEEDNVKVGNGDTRRLAENRNAEVGLASDATDVKDESASAADEKGGDASLVQKAEEQSQCEEKARRDEKSCGLVGSSKNGAGTSAVKQLDFDLNEEVEASDEMERYHSAVIGTRPTPSVAAFLSSENLLKGNKSELGFGWKGSAATSAFRPAEPRKPRENFLDFDLNVGAVDDNPPPPPPSSKYDSRNSGGGGLDLDLNLNDACEETPDVGVSFSNIPPKSLVSSGFDLNGPGVEEIPIPRNSFNVTRMGNVGSFQSSWFPPGSTYPPIPIQAQSYPIPQRMLMPMSAAAAPYNPEMFRGPVLSSSPAVAFQFPGFPFETNFSNTAFVSGPGSGPLCYPTIPTSQMVGPLSSAYRPYITSLPGGPSDNRKWGSNGLDLNSGPAGGPDLETLGFRQLPLADDHLKMLQQMAAGSGGGGGGGVLKRKEPVDGWDAGTYKHPSWQNWINGAPCCDSIILPHPTWIAPQCRYLTSPKPQIQIQTPAAIAIAIAIPTTIDRLVPHVIIVHFTQGLIFPFEDPDQQKLLVYLATFCSLSL